MKPHEEMYEVFRPLISAGRAEDVIVVLKKLIELWPDFAVAHNDLGVLYYNLGEKEKTLTHYQEAIRLQPENIIFLKNLADFYYVEEGRVEEAMQVYLKILESHPEDVETLLVTAHLCVSVGRFDDAKVFYNRVLEIEPWNSEVQENLEKLGKAVLAEIGSRSAEEMYREIQQTVETEQPFEAIQGLEKLIKSWPEFAIAHNDLGVLYYNTGEKEKALTHYEEAVQLQPENITFNKNLADFYYVEEGRVEEAMQIYVRVLESHPEDVETLLATGRICGTVEKYNDARIFYNRVLEIEPWNFEAKQNLESLGTSTSEF